MGSYMSEFNYAAPAELFAASGRSGLRYRRFIHAAEAIRYAVEKLPPGARPSARLEVEDSRKEYGMPVVPRVKKLNVQQEMTFRNFRKFQSDSSVVSGAEVRQ